MDVPSLAVLTLFYAISIRCLLPTFLKQAFCSFCASL